MSALRPRPEVARPQLWRTPPVERTRLPSGMRVLSSALPGRGLAAAHLLLDLPTTADPQGSEGTAVLLAHCLDEGTADKDAVQFADALEGLGATFHAQAAHDGLRVEVVAPGEALPAALALLVEAVSAPSLPESEVERLVAARADAIRQSMASPGQRARIAFQEAWYAAGERAAVPDGGTLATVPGLRRADLSALYQQRADPGLGTLVLVGDLGPDPAALAASAVEGWTPMTAARTPARADVASPGRRVVVVDKPDAVQTQIHLGLPGVDRRSPEHAAVAVLAWALGGTLTSRIDQVLREEKGYTYGIRMQTVPRRRGGTLVVSGSVERDVTAAAVADLMGILEAASTGGFTTDEVQDCVDYLVGTAPLNYETADALAGHLVSAEAADLEPGWLDGHLGRLQQVGPDALTHLAGRLLEADDRVLVVVGAADVIAEPLRALGLGEMTVLDA